MNAGQITMTKEEARERLQHYRRALHNRADEEYEATAALYGALAKGTPVIELAHAFTLAPLDEKGRPKMAIARADEKQVKVWSGNGVREFEPAPARHTLAMRARTTRIVDPRSNWRQPDGYALVPLVPPAVLGNRNPAKHWILWEVEQWADARLDAAPDRDPLLLRQIRGSLYAVVGQWDLTEVERMVMASRRTAR